MARKKKITRRQKLALGMTKPSGNSKYGKKAARQAKGKFGPNSPFTTKLVDVNEA